MTTLAELIDTDPTYTWGFPVPELQFGGGTWRFAFMIADQGAGSSVQWYDLTGPVSQVTWTRGASRPHGRFEAISPAVQINATDDTYAPWNPDTSGTFGTHVPLRAGRLLMRASVFRVSGSSVDLHLPLFTARVRRWSDAQAANGGYRFHRVDGIDLMSYLVQAPVAQDNARGWYPRFLNMLIDSDWPFGATIYGAQTADSTAVLTLAEQPAADSAITAFDASLDPVGITWRATAKGDLVAHPYPWDTFHAGLFASTTETIVGSEWTAPIETYYPTGPTFAYNAGPDEVQFTTELEGASFGINSDLENVTNEWLITHPVVATNLASGYATSAYDDAVSGGRFGRRAIPAASWLAENDVVLADFVDAAAYADLTAAPMTLDVRNTGVFPAIALLDHFDPCEIRHATRPGRTEVTVGGSVRQISHTMTKFGAHLLWSAIVQVDVDSESTSSPLNPVTNLAIDPPVTDAGVTFTWTNPSQTVTPTGTQVRITAVSTQWIDLPYPGTGNQSLDWGFLNPSSFYEFEIRLIREVNGSITHVSPVRSVSFTTASPAAPIIDPTDPDGGDGPTIIIPEDPGGCEEIDWKLESSDDGSSWTLVDSGDESDFVEVDGQLQLDLSAQSWTAGLLYRVCTRTACGTPGSYVCSEPFQPDCATPAILGDAPFDDASLKVYIPQVCGATIEDAVSDLPVSLGPAYAGVGFDTAGEYVLLSSTDGGVVVYGDSENLPLTDEDRSIHWRGKIDDVVPEDILWRVGRLRIAIIDVGSSVYKFAAIKSFSGGSITAIGTTTVVDDTEYAVYATWDRSTATVAIIVNGVEEATEEDAATYVNTPNLPSYSARLPASSYATDLAAWDSVVTTGAFDPTSIAGLEAWYDAADTTTISDATNFIWNDKANSHDLFKSGTQPSSGTRTLNGRNVVDFNNSPLPDPDNNGWWYDLGSSTMFVVAIADSVAGHANISALVYQYVNNTDSGDEFGLRLDGGTSKAQWLYYDVPTVRFVDVSTSSPYSAWNLWTCVIDPGTSTGIYNDGTLEDSTGSHTASALTVNRFALGGHTYGAGGGSPRNLDGAIAEVLIYDSVLGSTDREAVEAYLRNKWGL